MIYREGLDRLLHSRKFWLAVVALVQTIIFQLFPQFPQSLWISIDALIAVLITAIAIDDVSEPSALRFPEDEG